MIHVDPARALDEWSRLLGAQHVIRSSDQLREAERSTFALDRRIACIVRPGGVEEVAQCLRIASRHELPVYPVSSGRNWGYGSRLPPSDGCALLDLSRMDRILDFDENLAYVTVEPGVTQRRLFEFLRSRNSRLWMDATGSSPECSLIGNAMERGFGHTPYADHFAHSCALEAVLPSGEIIQTGLASLPGARAAPVYRAGVGPSFDGLFAQSNLGIVTRMTIWLMPEPEAFEAFFFQCEREGDLAPAIDALRPLRLSGTLRSAIHIANDYRVLGGIQRFPQGESSPISRARMADLRKERRFGWWNGSGALYGTRAQVAEARRLLKEALRGKVRRLQFLDERRLNLALRFATPYRWITGLDLERTVQLVRPVLGLLRGVPTDRTLNSAYWRKPGIPADPNPDRDRCGLIWSAPVAPLDGAQALELTRLAESILLGHGFEPMMTLTAVTDRALACVLSITYDRDQPGEDEKAMACYRELENKLYAEGFYPYRLGIQSMGRLPFAPSTANFASAMKSFLDPAHILAPGRYIEQEVKV